MIYMYTNVFIQIQSNMGCIGYVKRMTHLNVTKSLGSELWSETVTILIEQMQTNKIVAADITRGYQTLPVKSIA